MPKKKNKQEVIVPEIFEEAANQALSKVTKTLTLQEEVVQIGKKLIKEEDTELALRDDNLDAKPMAKNWDELKKAINTTHAARFDEVLNKLPDREFVRVYLKAVEYFKPKVVRRAGDSGNDKPTTINIQINKNYISNE